MHPATKHSTDPATPGDTPVFYPLDHLAVIDITGSDALNFLQGQGTQDYLKRLPREPLPGAFCTPKGRVVANVWNVLLASEPATVKLVTDRSSAETLGRHLGKYIPFFRGSKLTDQSQALHGLGLHGAQTDSWLTRVLGNSIDGIWHKGGHFAFHLPDGRAQLWLDALAEDYEQLMEQIEHSRVQPPTDWQRLDILAGYPWVSASLTGAFVPQSIGLERLDGISFNKGCYTGQEVISRLHYKGQSKRGLQRLRWHGDAEPESADIYTQTGTAGTWINWVTGGEHCLGLAMIKQSTETPTLFLDSERQIPLELLD
ncbi:YgfZ/GcvT domain-containing protein [Saccharospirillum impatiens]|uniref:CAF17-like 4Fe-4S cluster assembly/insertion protein YgfZ n=1 Tax=Saccharospirillum impatiens TaxID=169438 RepID=UPI000415F3C0|nr:folate-binding protein YgfZ [Saccharospirillum impatiens]